jgi:hypothetical protein
LSCHLHPREGKRACHFSPKREEAAAVAVMILRRERRRRRRMVVLCGCGGDMV